MTRSLRRVLTASLVAALLAFGVVPRLSAQLPHQSLGHLVTPTEWNDMIDAVNASTSTLASGLKATSYTTTRANVQNTTTETTALSFTVPANAWSDGDVIQVYFPALSKNNKGSVGSVAYKVNVGSGAQVAIGTQNPPDSASEIDNVKFFALIRRGSAVAVSGGTGVFAGFNGDFGSSLGTSTPTNFTSAITVSLKITLDAASSLFYVKPQPGLVIHFKN